MYPHHSAFWNKLQIDNKWETTEKEVKWCSTPAADNTSKTSVPANSSEANRASMMDKLEAELEAKNKEITELKRKLEVRNRYLVLIKK